MIFSTQYCFTIASIVFQASSLRDLFLQLIGHPISIFGPDQSENPQIKLASEQTYGVDVTNIWTFGFIVIFILTMFAWVRNISTFRFTFIFANALLLLSVSIVIVFSVSKIRHDGFGPQIKPINLSGMWTMVGFSIYTYEGIGVLMPCM